VQVDGDKVIRQEHTDDTDGNDFTFSLGIFDILTDTNTVTHFVNVGHVSVFEVN
jgi:hypothetical protein